MIDKFLMRSLDSPKKYFLSTALCVFPISIMTALHATLLAYVIDQAFLKHRSLQSLYMVLIYLLIIFTLKPLYQFYFDKKNRKFASQSKNFWRSRLMDYIHTHYRSLDDENTSGYFTTLASEGVENTDAYYSEFLPQFFTVIVNTLLLLCLSFYFDWISGLIMLVTAPLIPVFMILIGKTAQGVSLKQWDELKRMNGHLLDLLRGILTLRSYNLDQQQVTAVRRTSNDFKHKTLSVLKISFLSAFTLELTATLSTALIAVSLGVRLLYGKILFFPALCVLLLAPEYFMPLRQLGLKYHAAMNAKAFSAQLEKIENLFDEPAIATTNAPQILQNFETLSIDHLNFSYENDISVFKSANAQISLKAPVAVVGHSGVGKSTLLKLISGDLRPELGEIYLDKTPLSSLSTDEIHTLVAVVPQKPVLFNLSLLDNLRYGNPSLSKANVLDACQICQFSDVIRRLPNGLDTMIGEGAQSLSGGEAQLLSLTRAFLRKTQIILLDEPTSALDPISELNLSRALSQISNERSLIIAAHRKGTIQLCETHIHLKGGEAVAILANKENLATREPRPEVAL